MRNGERVEQSIQTEAGVQKGLVTILEERGLVTRNGNSAIDNLYNKNLVVTCQACKDHKTDDERLAVEGVTRENLNHCCLCRLLASQPDFADQRAWLAEVVEDEGCEIMFFPKYHCELNPIEMIWSWIKAYHRRTCKYNFKDLETELPKTIEERLPISFVRRAFRYCFRFMDGYRKGLTGPLLAYAVRVYKSHRCIPDFVLAQLEKGFNDSNKKARR
jgi:hypothetical protein